MNNLTPKELKYMSKNIDKYDVGIVGSHARLLLKEVRKLNKEIRRLRLLLAMLDTGVNNEQSS